MQTNYWFIACFITLPLCLSLISEEETALNVQVESGKVECFYIPVRKTTYKAMELNYRETISGLSEKSRFFVDGNCGIEFSCFTTFQAVVKGSPGNRDITMTLRDPRAIEVVSDQRVNYHNHRIVIADTAGSRGDYTLCLDNSYSYDDKVVAFSIYLLDEKGEYIGDQPTLSPNNALSIEIEVFESSTRRVKANLNRAENEMNLMRTVSLTDRSVAEQNFENVNWYGTLNTFVIVSAAAVQVFLIRSLLTDGSNVGKLLRKGRL